MRILIHRLGSLGDTVVALPCFYLIRETYPQAHITVLTNVPVSDKAAPLASILEHMGFIDAVMSYPMASRDVSKLRALHAELRRGRFDLMISLAIGRHLPTSVRDYVYFKSAGIKRIIGLPWAKRDRVCLMKDGGPNYEREADRLLRRVRSIGWRDPDDSQWTNLKLTAEELAEGDRLLREAWVSGPFMVASIGTKSPLKDWGLERWGRVYEQVGRAHPELTLVLIGSADEIAVCETLLDKWPGRRVNLCGTQGPRVSAAILRHARLFVGHDSGPTHLAAAVGTRCVTVYSAYAPPGQWFPLGKGHAPLYPYGFFSEELIMDAPQQQRALASITVEQVVEAVEKGLAAEAVSGKVFA